MTWTFLCYIYILGFIYTIHIYKLSKSDYLNLLKSIIFIFTVVSIIGIIQYIFNINLIERGIQKYPGALGRITSTGVVKEFVMPNTDKTAVEIEWLLDVPVREDLYEYIVNE